MRKKQTIRIVIVSILIVLVSCFGVFALPKILNEKPEEVIVVEEEPEIIEEVEVEDHWSEYFEINNEYIGHIYFESNLINLPVVQGDSNETYYRTNWETMSHDEEGSIFLDYRNNIDTDQNNIIYGHTVYESYEPSKTHMFTPLHQLIDVNNYEDNKYFYLDLKDRIEKYEVAMLYRCKIDEIDGIQYINPDEPAFYYTYYSSEEFDQYINLAKEREYYDTGVTINYDDKMVTLQTCYEGSPDKFIIIGKLIETKQK